MNGSGKKKHSHEQLGKCFLKEQKCTTKYKLHVDRQLPVGKIFHTLELQRFRRKFLDEYVGINVPLAIEEKADIKKVELYLSSLFVA